MLVFALKGVSHGDLGTGRLDKNWSEMTLAGHIEMLISMHIFVMHE